MIWVGVRKFLLIQQTAGKVTFNEAVYLFKDKINPARDAANPLDFLAAFTGTVRVKNLDTGSVTYTVYKNGVLQPHLIPTSKAANRTNDCYSIQYCRWDGYCTLTDLNYVHYGTETQGIDYCDTPTDDGVGCSQIQWSLSGSSSQFFCDGGGSGGGNDNGGGGGDNNGSGITNTQSIDKSQLVPCEDNVLTNLQATTGAGLYSLLQLFTTNTNGYNWTVKNGTLPSGTYGSTAQYDRAAGSVTTTFDSNHWHDATDLSIARTMLHEEIHAYLLAYFANNPYYANATFSTFVDAWSMAPIGADPNIYHHNEMAQGWVGDVAWALKQYGISQGYNLSDQFYSDMAWAGLEDTALFKAKPNAEQTRIHNTIQAEINGTDSSGNARPQSGRKAGC